MAVRRAEFPLDSRAVDIANKKLWEKFPELQGRQLTPDDEKKYRSYWMDQYEAAGGKVSGSPALSPKKTKEECPPKKNPNCGRSAADYKKIAEDKIAPAGADTLARNKAITKAYAEMYKSDPSTFKWAGMAAFASCEVGKGMKQAQDAPGWQRKAGAIFGAPPEDVQKALKTGNNLVYGDIYWQHLAYQQCGIADIEKAYEDGEIPPLVLEAWRDIDEGKKTGNQDKIWEGNRKLLRYEQQTVLQQGVYDNNPKMWKTLSGSLVSTFVQKIESPLPGDPNSFQDFVKGGNIGNFNDRWKWIDQSMLPKWKEMDRDPADALNKLSPCIQ